MDTRTIIGNNITRFLKENGISQVDLAQKLGVTKSAVSSWCTGIKAPRMDKIDAMAEIFGVKRSDFYAEKPIAHKYDELSEEEVQLIKMFRSIPIERRSAVLEAIRVLWQ